MAEYDDEDRMCPHAEDVINKAYEENRQELLALRGEVENAKAALVPLEESITGHIAVKNRAVRERQDAHRTLLLIAAVCRDHDGKRCEAVMVLLDQIGVK